MPATNTCRRFRAASAVGAMLVSVGNQQGGYGSVLGSIRVGAGRHTTVEVTVSSRRYCEEMLEMSARSTCRVSNGIYVSAVPRAFEGSERHLGGRTRYLALARMSDLFCSLGHSACSFISVRRVEAIRLVRWVLAVAEGDGGGGGGGDAEGRVSCRRRTTSSTARAPIVRSSAALKWSGSAPGNNPESPAEQ
jgi:hypothetical protein